MQNSALEQFKPGTDWLQHSFEGKILGDLCEQQMEHLCTLMAKMR